MYEYLNFIEDEAFVVNASHEVSFLNSRVTIKSHSGVRCYEVIENRESPCSWPLWECPLSKVIKSSKPLSIIHPYPSEKDVEPRYLKLSLFPLSDGLYLEIRRNVSAERRLEKQIIIHHNHLDAISKISSAVSGLRDLRRILETALDTILDIYTGCIGGIMLYYEKDSTLRYEVIRGLALSLFEGKEVKEGEGISGKVLRDGMPRLISDLEREGMENLKSFLDEGVRSFMSVPLKTKEKVVGVLNVMSNRANRFTREDMYLLSSVGHQLGMAIEQARLNERLRNARERYRKLLEVAISIQEEERKRIARDLHDETSQNLTALALNLEAIKEMIEDEGLTKEVKELIKKSHSIAISASVELSKIIRELRPTLLDTLGLGAAISHLVDSNLRSKNIEATVEFAGAEGRLSPDVELALFRITQEALSNIVRHSKAQKARISLECDQDGCKLVIEDDGVGFNVSEIKTIDEGGRGAGLFGMKERVRLVGGRCNIDSEPGKGTRINVYVPREKVTGDEDKDIYS